MISTLPPPALWLAALAAVGTFGPTFLNVALFALVGEERAEDGLEEAGDLEGDFDRTAAAGDFAALLGDFAALLGDFAGVDFTAVDFTAVDFAAAGDDLAFAFVGEDTADIAAVRMT